MSEMMGVTARVRVRPEWVGDDWREKMPPPLVDLLDELEYWDVDGPEAETITAYGDINYGFSSVSDEMEELRAGLQEHGIAYAGQTDAKYEFDGDITWWVPSMEGPDARGSTNNGDTALSGAEYAALVRQYMTTPAGVFGLKSALDAHFADPWAQVANAPLPPIYEPEEA